MIIIQLFVLFLIYKGLVLGLRGLFRVLRCTTSRALKRLIIVYGRSVRMTVDLLLRVIITVLLL